MKKVPSFMIAVMLVCLVTIPSYAVVADNINTTAWVENVDYMYQIKSILNDNPTNTEFELASAYEKLRNAKIESLGIDLPKTYYFDTYFTSVDIMDAIYRDENPVVEPDVSASDYDVDILARVLFLEAGSSWIPDWVVEYCASVIVNRINHASYPDTLEGVLSQRGQFSTWKHIYSCTPPERCYTIARDVLENGSKTDSSVIYFANFKQGSNVYATYINPYGGNLYFCS